MILVSGTNRNGSIQMEELPQINPAIIVLGRLGYGNANDRVQITV